MHTFADSTTNRVAQPECVKSAYRCFASHDSRACDKEVCHAIYAAWHTLHHHDAPIPRLWLNTKNDVTELCVEEVAKRSMTAYDSAVFGPALPNRHNERTPVFKFVESCSAGGEGGGVGANSVFVAYDIRVFSAVFRCIDITKHMRVKIRDGHIDVDEDDLTHIETTPLRNPLHLSVYFREAPLNDALVKIIAYSVKKLDIPAVTLAKYEIKYGEHPRKSLGISDDNLFSMAHAAFVGSPADCHTKPSVVRGTRAIIHLFAFASRISMTGPFLCFFGIRRRRRRCHRRYYIIRTNRYKDF